MLKVTLNSRLPFISTIAFICFIFLYSCKNDDHENDDHEFGKMTIMSHPQDPQLFNFLTTDGYELISYGERDTEGMPVSIDYMIMINTVDNDTTIMVSFDSEGRTSQLSTKYTIIDLEWESSTYANIKIGLLDGSKQIYTSLDLSEATKTRSKKSANKRLNRKNNGLQVDMKYPAIKPSTRGDSQSTENMTLIANIFHPGDPLSKEFDGDVFVKAFSNGKTVDHFKLKRADNEKTFYGMYPICPNGIQNSTSLIDKLSDLLFQKSKNELKKEIEDLSSILSDSEKGYMNLESTFEEFRKYTKKSKEVAEVLNSKKVELKERFETDVRIFCYATLSGAIFTSPDVYTTQCGSINTYTYSIPLEDTYIKKIYLDPKNPKPNTGGFYTVYIEVCNIYSGVSLDVQLTGTDGYTQNGNLTYNKDEGYSRAYMDIPVALESGIKDEIKITLTKTNLQTIERHINTVF